MRVLSTIGSGLLSCGASQAFGFTALGVTATLAIRDLVKKAIFESKLKQTGQANAFYDFYKNKVTECNSKLNDYKNLPKCLLFVWFL